MSHLVLIDTRGIKSYVDSRRYLGELRVASKRLEQAVQDTVSWLVEQVNIETIYAGGGNALITMEEELSAELKNIISHQFKTNLGYNQIDYDKPPYLLIENSDKADQLLDSNFAKARLQLLSYVGKLKRSIHLSRNNPASYLPEPNSTICISCQMRIATTSARSYIGNDEEEELCQYCYDLRQEGMEELRADLRNLASQYDIDIDMADFNEYQLEFFSGQNLDDLHSGNGTKGRQRLTVVQMDGNLFGDVIASIQTKDNLRRISELVYETMNNVFDEYIMNISEYDVMDAIRIKLGKIYIGGDDLRSLVPGRHALPMSNFISKRFYNQIKSEKELHLSAGIAAGRPKTPISSLIELSTYLLKSAKVVHEPKFYGSFDFEVTNSLSFTNSVKTFREFNEKNYEQHVDGYNFTDKVWNLICEEAEINEINPSIDESTIKSSYLNTWKSLQQRYLQNIERGKNALLLFSVYQGGRASKKGSTNNKYGNAVKLIAGMDNEYSHLQRAIDLISLRYDL